jgi:hypothetical protein
MFYEMLTGQRPFRGSTIIGIIQSHRNDPIPVLPPELSRFQRMKIDRGDAGTAVDGRAAARIGTGNDGDAPAAAAGSADPDAGRPAQSRALQGGHQGAHTVRGSSSGDHA